MASSNVLRMLAPVLSITIIHHKALKQHAIAKRKAKTNTPPVDMQETLNTSFTCKNLFGAQNGFQDDGETPGINNGQADFQSLDELQRFEDCLNPRHTRIVGWRDAEFSINVGLRFDVQLDPPLP